MYKMKRIIALVMTALLIGSTACGPVLAAEVTGEEPVSVQEETPDKEEVQEVVEETDLYKELPREAWIKHVEEDEE